MKKIFLTAVLAVLSWIVFAQQEPSTNQNPRYKESQDKYSKMIDSLVKWHGVTLQQTYKAYDWYEARQARRQQRREWRHQQIMTHGYDNGYYFNGYYNNFGFGRYGTYPYYNSRFNYFPYNYPYRPNRWNIGVGFGW